MSDSASWVPLVLWTAVLAVPLFYLVGRVGLPRWWSAIALVPIFGGAVLLWMVAFKQWPSERGDRPGLI